MKLKHSVSKCDSCASPFSRDGHVYIYAFREGTEVGVSMGFRCRLRGIFGPCEMLVVGAVFRCHGICVYPYYGVHGCTAVYTCMWLWVTKQVWCVRLSNP